ncbi:MAG: DegV family protein [Asgard group archaeon]|nr:DegV family protein [Asgard group archaeon]
MAVKIMTDSAADISEDFIRKYDLSIVPTVIRFGDEIFYEHVDLNLEEYYEKFHSSEIYPQTANPTLQHQYEMFEKLGKEADEIMNIVISSGISGSYNTAINAKRMYEKKNGNPAKIHIYDSKFATFALGMIALKAAELAKQEKSAETIIPQLDKYRDTLEVGFTVADLKYLHRGGRLNRSKYWIAKLIDMKPVINFIDGKMEVIKTAKGHEKAVIESFLSVYEKKGKPEKFNAYIMHAQNPDSALLLKKYIEEEIRPIECNISISPVGMTIVTHAGPGCIGICLDTEYKFLDQS